MTQGKSKNAKSLAEAEWSCQNISEVNCSTTTEEIESISIPGTPDPFEHYSPNLDGSYEPEHSLKMTRLMSAPTPMIISLCDQLPISNDRKIVKVVSLDDLIGHDSGFRGARSQKKRRKNYINPRYFMHRLPPPTRYISLDVILNSQN